MNSGAQRIQTFFRLQNWLVEISFPRMARIKFLGSDLVTHGYELKSKAFKACYPSVPLSLGITT